MVDLSFVIPALNEQDNIPKVLRSIPTQELDLAGLVHEVIVVDNGSTDDTARVAAAAGAQVVHQPLRGYGSAYKAGFDAARGAVLVTGDADCTYPFDHTPALLARLEDEGLDFLSTNRLSRANRAAMKRSHHYANHFLTLLSRTLFHAPFRDSQSGMWVFRREMWPWVDVRSEGMAFSQELKNEAYACGFRCGEAPIEYRIRGGEVKLHALRDGMTNVAQMFSHRVRRRGGTADRPTAISPAVADLPAVDLRTGIPVDDAA